MKLWCDLETYSPKSLKTHGAHSYAEEAEILLFPYAIDDGPARVWDCTSENMPRELSEGIEAADEYWWQNGGMFDRPVLKWAMPEVYQAMAPEKWRDTLVQALSHGLPGSLDSLSDIFKLGDESKDKRGKFLITLFCIPKKDGTRNTRETHPEQWEEFKEYAIRDIISMRLLHKKMPKWNYPNNKTELALWHLDQEINMAGVFVDTELARKAVEAVEIAQAELSMRVCAQTNGEVSSANKRDKLLKHILSEYGVSLPDMRASTLERRIADPDLPYPVKELLSIRLMASTSSVSKYKRLLKAVSSDGRLRGIIQFAGAARTARDAGRLFQPQNLMRPTLKKHEISEGIKAIKAECVELVTDNVMELAANCMRAVITAPPGKKLVIADLSNIEGRALAWLAGEEWKLQAFRDFDTVIGRDSQNNPIRKGADLYRLAYARAFNCPLEEVGDFERQVGKVLELALGYEGGVGAFVTFATVYGLDLEKLPRDGIPSWAWAEAESFLEWMKEQKRPTFGLSDAAFITCDALKRMWRAAHPKTVALWRQAANAFKAAIYDPEKNFPVGDLCHAVRKGNWLRIVLPSGRSLSYPSPRFEDRTISFAGVNHYTRKFGRAQTYSGKIVENMTQAVARDVFKAPYPAIMAAGYVIKLPVHDELITETPDDPRYNALELSELMASGAAWTKGSPLAAAGFETYAYRKG
jgi:DNA polymerase